LTPLRPRGGLWRHADFLRLWTAQAVSAMGSRVTRTALPVLAVVALDGSPTEVAVIAALGFGPGALVGLVAGGWVDRAAKRPILIGCDLVRALAVATLPLAAWYGRLTVVQVAAVAVVVGAATALFQIADVAYLPALVQSDRLVEGNARLQSTESIAEIVGPGLGGVLIQALGAPLAVLLDSLSYVWSALWLGAIRARERVAAAVPRSLAGLREDLRVGFAAAWHEPRMRPLLFAGFAIAFFGGSFIALYSLYLLRDLGLSTAALGGIVGVGGVGALAGAALGPRVADRLGVGPTLVASLAGNAVASALIPLAGAAGLPTAARVALLAGHQLFGDGSLMVFSIFAVTLRQTVVPADRLARVNALFQVVQGALLPVAALAAGPLASALGTRAAFWGATACAAAAPLALLASPLARLRRLPAD
jgi:MFS family permease